MQHSPCCQTSYNVISTWPLCKTIKQKEQVVLKAWLQCFLMLIQLVLDFSLVFFSFYGAEIEVQKQQEHLMMKQSQLND